MLGRDVGHILKGIGDTFVNKTKLFSVMVLQSFLKWDEFWRYLYISF